MNYNLEKIETELINNLKSIESLILKSIKLQLVQDEINQVYLETNIGYKVICPRIGGEVISLENSEAPINTPDTPIISAFDQFNNKTIAQARAIGSAFNGHGLEISFENNPVQTLIISSVACFENNSNINDALRISITNYIYEVGE